MFVCTSEALKATITPWGAEVQRRLKERGMTQTALANLLHSEGISSEGRGYVCELLRGRRANSKNGLQAVSAINRILEIPEEL